MTVDREPAAKRDALRRLLRAAPDFKNAIIFCNRKRDVHTLYRSLERHGFNVAALHGDLDQRARMAALEGFRTGATQLLVASDVAARGLDIPDVSHVFNFDVPHHAEDYVHRIGRTGRAGRSGTAVTIATSEDSKSLAAIENLTGQPIPLDGTPLPADTGGDRSPADDGDDRPARGSRSSDRRGRGERRPRAAPRNGARAPSDPEPAIVAAPITASPSRTRSERGASPVRAERASPRHAEREEPNPVGFGDHVPSFLLRPVRVP